MVAGVFPRSLLQSTWFLERLVLPKMRERLPVHLLGGKRALPGTIPSLAIGLGATHDECVRTERVLAPAESREPTQLGLALRSTDNTLQRGELHKPQEKVAPPVVPAGSGV